jgi:hypothetical protein
VIFQTGDNDYAIVVTSIDHGIELKEGVIRAEIITELTICEPVADDATRTHLQTISLVDLKGSIPSVLVNNMMKRRAAYYNKLKDFVQMHIAE